MSTISMAPAHDAGSRVGSLESEAWARQRTVMLAFVRRINASGARPTLIDDAASLLAETLEMSHFASARWREDRSNLDLRLTGFDGVTRDVQLPWDPSSSSTESLSGYAMSRCEVVVCPNLDDSQFKDGLLRTYGMKSGMVVPLGTAERSVGAFGVFATVERAFSSHEVEFAETIGQMVSATLARLHAEACWQNERRLAAALFEDSPEPSLLTDLEGRVIRANRACGESLGYSGKELLERSLWGGLVAADDLHPAQRFARAALEQKSPAPGILPLRNRHGHLKAMTCDARAVVDESGQAVSILFSGIATDPATASLPRDAQSIPVAADDSAPVAPSKRRAFPYRQRVAKYEPDRPPESLSYSEVQFEDISASGVSFFLDYKPTFDTVVLALGAPPNLHYLSARIASVTEMTRDGKRMYKIGGRFLERW